MAIAPLVLLFIIAVLIALGVVLTIVRARGKVTHPVCGGCGYAVEGLEVLRCPECGCDLREVGIMTPTMSRGLSPGAVAVLAAVAWTMLIPLPALIATRIVSSMIPTQYHNRITVTYGPGPNATFPTADITFDGRGRRPGQGFSVAQLRLLRADSTSSDSLVVDLAGQTCRIEPAGAPAAAEQPFDAAAVLDWMRAAGVAADNDLAVVQSNDLYASVLTLPVNRSAATTGGFRSVTMGSTSAFRPKPWFMPLAFIVWGAIWLGGILLILRRYRRRRVAARAPVASPASP